MAFGTGSNSFGPNTTLYSFTIKTKDLPEPKFDVKKKVGDKYETLPDKVTRVSGNIIGIKHKVFNHNGKDIKSVNVTFQDKDDVYFVSVGYTFLGRNILNSLLDLKTFENVEIGLYQSKPKPDAPAGATGFASASVRQGPERELIYGHFDKAELPAVPKIKINGQLMSNTEEIDAFYEKHIAELSKRVQAAAKTAASETAGGESAAPEGDGAAANEEFAPSGGNPAPF